MEKNVILILKLSKSYTSLGKVKNTHLKKG